LAPLAIGIFRTLWIAQLVSNIGTWMQQVGAQWLLVETSHAALLTALVQAASLLPVILLSLPAGVLADSLNRRWLLVGANGFTCLAAGLLTVLTWRDGGDPATVLILTFALGCGAAVANPTWQAIQPDLVPRRLLLPASAADSANINIARAVGPALAGALIAWSGPALVFALNTVSFLAVVAALLTWRQPPPSRGSAGLGPSIVSGLRYVRNAPGFKRVTLRVALFVFPASALWSLLAVLAHGVLRQESGAYGLMLAALGIGAVAGALMLPALRGRFSNNALVAGATLIFGLSLGTVALLQSLAAVLAVLAVAGIGWVCVLSILNTAMMLTLPAWVRARSLAVYNVVFMGGQGIGALLWGTIAAIIGVVPALLLAAALTVAALLTLPVWPLYSSTGDLDRTVVAVADSVPDAALPTAAGPVLIQIEYVVKSDQLPAFVTAMRALATSRRRTGATSWELWHLIDDSQLFVEQYSLHNWGEHIAQREERMTGYDRELETRAAALAEPNPVVRHLIKPKSVPIHDRGIAVADQLTRETKT
jgi:MFS family permease